VSDKLEKSLLEELYWKKGLSIRQIAKKLGKSKFGIHYWMEKYKIPRRSFKIKSNLKEKLVKMYKNGESTCSIARKLKMDKSSVFRCLKESCIKIRSHSEAAKLGVIKGRIKIQKHIIPASSKVLTKEKAYMMGVLCGDGYLCYIPEKRLYQISLEATDKEFVEKFAECLYKVYGIKIDVDYVPVRILDWSDKFRARLCCKVACEDLLRYDTTYKTFEWKIPGCIKESTLEIIAEFIKGFADSEGGVDKGTRRIGMSSVNKEGLEEIKLLLELFGIRSKVKSKSKKYKKGFVLRIQDRKSIEKFAKVIGFIIKRKSNALSACLEEYKFYTTPHEEVKKLQPKLLELRKQGYSFNEIAKMSNISIATVWRNTNNLKDRNRLIP